MKKLLLTIFINLLSLPLLQAQVETEPGPWLLRFQPGIRVSDILASHAPSGFRLRLVSERFRLVRAEGTGPGVTAQSLRRRFGDKLSWISTDRVEMSDRQTPDDPLYGEQWALPAIHAPNFWDRTTGGPLPGGYQPVVAVMESGMAVQHPDLAPSIWHNPAEIPGDGIDNDLNGYIDDYTGWNTATNNDQHSYDAHGTQVAGIIGAKGNNSLGITGIGWDVRILPISFSKSNISSYFKAFDYMITQRRLFNETNGQAGAFIVAVNESFGKDFARPGDDPKFELWCEYMDSLGAVGILTVAATSNNTNVNVDEQGDMPTTCPQDFLIAITSISQDGTRYGAFGPENVDLAAPGINIRSTYGPDAYANFDGTSAATPHVAGAIALIYSFPCQNWSNYVKQHPADAALQVKQWLLNNTRPLPALANRTKSNGTLDLLGVIEELDLFCEGNPLQALNVHVQPNPVRETLTIKYDTPAFGEFRIRIYDAMGRLVLHRTLETDQFTPQKIKLDTSPLAPGLYIVQISQGRHFVTRRFIKSR